MEEKKLWQDALKYAARQDLKNLDKIVYKLSCIDTDKKAKLETQKIMKAC